MISEDYECEGQLELSDFFKSKITNGKVMDLTHFINSQGKAQYTQIGEVIEDAFDKYKDDADVIGRITNMISIWVLQQGMKYMEYLKEQSEV